MPTHAEKRTVPHSAELMYELVADVEKYPDFLPWCVATRIRKRNEDTLTADMVIGFKMFREKFTSVVDLSTPGTVNVKYQDGPFKYLNNHWIFTQQEDGGCVVDFFVDFEFKSKILQKAIGVVFNEAVKVMIDAFEKRANQLDR